MANEMFSLHSIRKLKENLIWGFKKYLATVTKTQSRLLPY
jgi:hypothetical protein